LIGEGAQEDILKEMMSNLNLNNVEILPYQNRFEIKKSLEKVDACFTSFFKTPILETNSPNKFFDGLAASKLSIVNTKGWLKELVEQNSCGFYTDPSTPEKFPELIKQFVQNESLLRSYQENALRLAKDTFSKEALVDKAYNFILNKF
jgi:glycosyltransferase involved in cell wall biosynthesis